VPDPQQSLGACDTADRAAPHRRGSNARLEGARGPEGGELQVDGPLQVAEVPLDELGAEEIMGRGAPPRQQLRGAA
jgi:hypothetical protein